MTPRTTIPQVVFSRRDDQRVACELIPVHSGWEQSRTLPRGYHRHQFHELLWVDYGSSRHRVDLQEYVVTPAACLFMPSGSIHWYEGPEECSGGLLLFSDEFLTTSQAEAVRYFALFDPLRASLLCEPTPPERASIGRLLAEMQDEQTQPTLVGGATVLQNLLVAVLHKLEAATRPVGQPAPPAGPAGVGQHFRVLLEAHFRREHSPAFYATALRCSPRQLTTALRTALGGSTQYLIGERLVLEAKRMLAYSDQRVGEIAYQLGFEDPAYFSRLFRQKSGQTAEGFRAMHAEVSR